MRKNIIFLLAVLCLSVASDVNAENVYSSTEPISQEVVTMTGPCCSGPDNFKEYGSHYEVPSGVTFNRIALSGEIVSGTVTISVSVMNEIGDYNFDTFSGSHDELLGLEDDTVATSTSVTLNDLGDGLLVSDELFTYTTLPNQYIAYYINSSGSMTVGKNMVVGNGITYHTNPTSPYFSISRKAQAFALCDGLCSDVTFSPIAELTDSPWARITSPTASSSIYYNRTFNVQYNTGTTSVAYASLVFTSNYQTILPYIASTTATGLNTFQYQASFPAIEDTITARVDLYDASSTLIASSPTYTYNVVTQLNPESQETDSYRDQLAQACSQYNIVLSGLCAIFYVMFVPPQIAYDSFINMIDVMRNKYPFVYAFELENIVETLPLTSSSTPTISLTLYGDEEIPIISEGSYDQFMSSEIAQILYLLAQAGIYILLAFALWDLRKTLFT